MSGHLESPQIELKPSRVGVIFVYLAFAAVLVRTFGEQANRPYLSWYLGLELVYLVLYTLVLWKYTSPQWMINILLIALCLVGLGVLSIRPEFDFVILFFFLLTYPVSLSFSGKLRWVWIGALVLLTSGSLVYFLGLLRGLALSLTTVAGEIVIPAYLMVNNETQKAQKQSQLLLDDLQHAHHQSQIYAGQVEELAAVQERNRLARELHDTVSQLMFSISLTARSAELLLEKDPALVAEQLEGIRSTSTEALSQLRSLILQLRPPQG